MMFEDYIESFPKDKEEVPQFLLKFGLEVISNESLQEELFEKINNHFYIKFNNSYGENNYNDDCACRMSGFLSAATASWSGNSHGSGTRQVK